MNILVTGANGQLGSELRLIASTTETHRYVFTDIAELDILSRQDVRSMLASERIDVIVNCAAYTQVDQAELSPEQCDRVNHLAPRLLAEEALAVGATLIHISTDYVFAGDHHRPYTEMDAPRPINVYGQTKRAGEEAIVASGCRYLILRTSWLYSTFGGNFVKTMRRLMNERERIAVVSDQIGSPTYARDLALAIHHIIERNQLTYEGIYHFSNEGVASWYDFACAIAELSQLPCLVSPCLSADYPTTAARPYYSVLDKSRFKQAFGGEIPHWRTSLQACIQLLDSSKQ